MAGIVALLGDTGHQSIQVRKVVSHGQVSLATGPLEEWAYWHNNLTDQAADGINRRRSPEFWKAWVGLAQALEFHRGLHEAILRMLLQTSRLAAVDKGRRWTGHLKLLYSRWNSMFQLSGTFQANCFRGMGMTT